MATQGPDGSVHTPVDEPKDQIENLFTYHAPSEEQKEFYLSIRKAGMDLAKTIDTTCPPSPDRTMAIRKVREAIMTANASIATDGGFYK